MLSTPLDLFNWRSAQVEVDTVQPWKPEPLTAEHWPPNYKAVYAWRIRALQRFRDDPESVQGALHYYKTRPKEFILHWIDTYDPRKPRNKWVPFIFFMKQAELIDFFDSLRKDAESGLIEKCRDAGATWCACAYSIHSWLFIPSDSIGWGSRKAMLVDELGNPDSIFEKMRLILRRLPACFLPPGFSEKKHATYMKFINPTNGATINGEAGDNIGRGGRKSMYFKDESAHYERPELIEAALGDNTNVQVDISSVNGLGNVFHKRRQAGVDWQPGTITQPGFVRVFTVDWRDHPEKTQEWYDVRRAKYEREGMLHLFAQEVDRDYSAAASNTIIPKQWLMACIDAHIKLGWTAEQIGSKYIAGLDIADGGIDRNGLVGRQGVVCRFAEEWGERDPGVTARRTAVAVRVFGSCSVQYDSIGVGAAVKSEFNRMVEEKLLDPVAFPFVAWNAGGSVIDPFFRVIPDDPNSVKNGDFFHNIKAQAWWSMRTRVYKTFKAVTEGATYPIDELISLDSRISVLYQLIEELAQPQKKETTSLKMVVNKQPDGMKSPNLGDSAIMCYFPIPQQGGAIVGRYGASANV